MNGEMWVRAHAAGINPKLRENPCFISKRGLGQLQGEARRIPFLRKPARGRQIEQPRWRQVRRQVGRQRVNEGQRNASATANPSTGRDSFDRGMRPASSHPLLSGEEPLSSVWNQGRKLCACLSVTSLYEGHSIKGRKMNVN